MFDEKKSLEMLEGFEAHFNYDTSYMKEMLLSNPSAFEKFENFLPMASFVNKALVDDIYLVKIATMKNEDCGACLQLNVDMAIEAGASKEMIKEVVFNEGKNLSEDLKELYSFTLLVANNKIVTQDLYDKIQKKYAKEVLVEFSLAIASAKVFPAVKRVLNDIKSCSVIQIKV